MSLDTVVQPVTEDYFLGGNKKVHELHLYLSL